MSSEIPYKPCGAKKRNGEPCRGAAMPNGRCRLHGGLSSVGPANGMFKHGLYSKVFPRDMRAAFKRASEHPELMSLSGEVAGLTVKMQNVLVAMDKTDAPPWGEAVEALNDLMVARGKKDDQGEAEALVELNNVMRQGAGAAKAQSALWAEFRAIALEKEKLVTAERNWMAKLRTMYTAEQGLMLMAAIREAANKEWGDQPDRLSRFLDRTLRLLDDPNKPKNVEQVD